jgi:hypothetical protein
VDHPAVRRLDIRERLGRPHALCACVTKTVLLVLQMGHFTVRNSRGGISTSLGVRQNNW